MSYKSYNVSSENLLLAQLIIPLDIFLLLSSLDCLLDIVRRNSALDTHGNWKGYSSFSFGEWNKDVYS